VAWMGDLRHINDHLLTLRNHPLEEVRTVALAIEEALIEKFPSSFGTKRYEKTEAYAAHMGQLHAYLDYELPSDFELLSSDIDRELLFEYRPALLERPVKAELPFAIRECGVMRFGFLLDFGSFRDLQRHRAIITRMPLLGRRHGFEQWYLRQLPAGKLATALKLLRQQLSAIESLKLAPEIEQYYLPMGMRTSTRTTGDLRGLVYFAELRTTRHVHPTLRFRAQQTAEVLLEKIGPAGLVLHLDNDPDRFDVVRGTHDIVEK